MLPETALKNHGCHVEASLRETNDERDAYRLFPETARENRETTGGSEDVSEGNCANSGAVVALYSGRGGRVTHLTENLL